MVDLLISSLKLGIIISIMTLGVHISYRILDAADLSIEGIFPLGGAICASLIFFNVPPIVATIVAVIGGAIGGLITGTLHTKLKIPMILSGIITMTGLYSINMVIQALADKNVITLPTLYISYKQTVFFGLRELFINWGMKITLAQTLSTLIIAVIFMAVVYGIIYFFFGTEIGMSIRATGDNAVMARANGINTNGMIILGLMISNALIALAGALFAQDATTANVTSGRGMIVVGLAAIIIGETIFGRKTYKKQLISIIIGTMIYYVLRGVAIQLNLADILDLVSAILIVICLSLPLIKGKKKIKGEARC